MWKTLGAEEFSCASTISGKEMHVSLNPSMALFPQRDGSPRKISISRNAVQNPKGMNAPQAIADALKVNAAHALMPTYQEGLQEVSLTHEGFIVIGCGTSRFDGVYWPDPTARQRVDMCRAYRQERGSGTLEFFRGGTWYISENCGGSAAASYHCRSSSSTPPLYGWEAPFGGGKTPAPSLERRLVARLVPVHSTPVVQSSTVPDRIPPRWS